MMRLDVMKRVENRSLLWRSGQLRSRAADVESAAKQIDLHKATTKNDFSDMPASHTDDDMRWREKRGSSDILD